MGLLGRGDPMGRANPGEPAAPFRASFGSGQDSRAPQTLPAAPGQHLLQPQGWEHPGGGTQGPRSGPVSAALQGSELGKKSPRSQCSLLGHLRVKY